MHKTQLRNEKLEKILEDKEHGFKYTDMKQGFVAITEVGNEEEFLKNRKFAIVTTDYFGGFGDQTAEVYDNGKCIYSGDTLLDYREMPINTALRELGVVRSNAKDEFDTIGLGNYRCNEDFV